MNLMLRGSGIIPKVESCLVGAVEIGITSTLHTQRPGNWPLPVGDCPVVELVCWKLVAFFCFLCLSILHSGFILHRGKSVAAWMREVLSRWRRYVGDHIRMLFVEKRCGSGEWSNVTASGIFIMEFAEMVTVTLGRLLYCCMGLSSCMEEWERKWWVGRTLGDPGVLYWSQTTNDIQWCT